MPANKKENKVAAETPGASKASGKECKNAVANKIPTEKLTMFSTILVRNLKDSVAAIVILTTPAAMVANEIENKMDMVN